MLHVPFSPQRGKAWGGNYTAHIPEPSGAARARTASSVRVLPERNPCSLSGIANPSGGEARATGIRLFEIPGPVIPNIRDNIPKSTQLDSLLHDTMFHHE